MEFVLAGTVTYCRCNRTYVELKLRNLTGMQEIISVVIVLM